MSVTLTSASQIPLFGEKQTSRVTPEPNCNLEDDRFVVATFYSTERTQSYPNNQMSASVNKFNKSADADSPGRRQPRRKATKSSGSRRAGAHATSNSKQVQIHSSARRMSRPNNQSTHVITNTKKEPNMWSHVRTKESIKSTPVSQSSGATSLRSWSQIAAATHQSVPHYAVASNFELTGKSERLAYSVAALTALRAGSRASADTNAAAAAATVAAAAITATGRSTVQSHSPRRDADQCQSPHHSCSSSSMCSRRGPVVLHDGSRVLNPEQVQRLQKVLKSSRTLCSPVASPIASILPYAYLRSLLGMLKTKGIKVASVCLEGSSASHVLCPESFPRYNDIDVRIELDSQDRDTLCAVREVILDSLLTLPLAQDVTQMPPTVCGGWANGFGGTRDPYGILQKMWISPPRGTDSDADAWALFTLGAPMHGGLDLKFVQRLNRGFLFTIDSFQLELTSLIEGRQPLRTVSTARVQNCSGIQTELCKHYNDPTTCKYGDCGTRNLNLDAAQAKSIRVRVRCGSSNFDQATRDLQHMFIGVDDEADLASVRGGGLFKYASYVSKGFVVRPGVDLHRMARYMVTRFMMDFPASELSRYGTPAQLQAINDYLSTHYAPAQLALRYRFLQQVHLVLRLVESRVQDIEPFLETVIFVQGYMAHYQHTLQKASRVMCMDGSNQENGQTAKNTAVSIHIRGALPTTPDTSTESGHSCESSSGDSDGGASADVSDESGFESSVIEQSPVLKKHSGRRARRASTQRWRLAQQHDPGSPEVPQRTVAQSKPKSTSARKKTPAKQFRSNEENVNLAKISFGDSPDTVTFVPIPDFVIA